MRLQIERGDCFDRSKSIGAVARPLGRASGAGGKAGSRHSPKSKRKLDGGASPPPHSRRLSRVQLARDSSGKRKLTEKPSRSTDFIAWGGPKRRRAGALKSGVLPPAPLCYLRSATCGLPPAVCRLRSYHVHRHCAVRAADFAAFRGADGVGECV